jgi:circadian clock protein KaiB
MRLFVAGATARSRQAVLRVRELCAAELKDNCKLEVIDIYQQPHLARANQIVAAPTLIIELPRPVRRFIGSLLNIADLFVELDPVTKGKIVV